MGPISMYADGKSNWFVAGVSPVHAGEWTNPTTFGLRDVATGASKYYRVPSTGDLLYMDFYETTLGLIVGPKTSTPNSVNVEAIGQTVTFSAPAEGLAMSDPLDDGSDPEDTEGPTFGSVWQSSPDGVTWTDMEGADGPELTLTATEESITLQYRRHFFDRFWGEQNSTPAQMSTQKPKITRADDLPAVSAEKRFPAQTITASGQPDMTWSSSDLPAGLTINSSTGEITGTAPKAGEYQFTVTVTDAFGTDAKLFHLKSTDTSVVPPVDPKPEPKPDPKPKPTPAPTPKPNELANTGINNWGAAGMAFALLALGAVGVLSSKRRTARLQH